MSARSAGSTPGDPSGAAAATAAASSMAHAGAGGGTGAGAASATAAARSVAHAGAGGGTAGTGAGAGAAATRAAGGTSTGGVELDAASLPGRPVATWVKERAAEELQRVLAVPGQRALSIPVNNTALVHERTGLKKGDVCVVNRLECATKFDFSKVAQILVGPPTPCPLKRGFSYVNLVLFAAAAAPAAAKAPPVAMLVPYLYDTGIPDNDLTQWLFVNSKGAKARLAVPTLSEVGGGGRGSGGGT